MIGGALQLQCEACEISEYEAGLICECGLCQDCCQCGSRCDCPACMERISLGHDPRLAELPIKDAALPRIRRGGLRAAVVVTALMPFFAEAEVEAKDFGTIGQVYPIIEDDFLDMIRSGFQAMEDDGRMTRIREEAVTQVKKTVERPRGAILPRADKPRSFTVDLSITLERDLADQEGRVFARAGTVVNPLQYSRFNKRIVMIDGDDPDQVSFALADGNELDTLIVLARGEWRSLMNTHGRRFWFDMDQQMLNKFGIQALPSVITRADPLMLIEEVPVGKDAIKKQGQGR